MDDDRVLGQTVLAWVRLSMSDEAGFGIVVFDLGGGDAAQHFVDKERWEQIADAHAQIAVKDGWQDAFNDLVGWLTADESPEVVATVMPERRGKVLGTMFTQTFVLEVPKPDLQDAVVGPILGMLTIR